MKSERIDAVTKYRVDLHYPDGEIVEDEDLFSSVEEAFEHGEYLCGCASLGAEILNLSNPGDYPLDDTDIQIEVVEVD